MGGQATMPTRTVETGGALSAAEMRELRQRLRDLNDDYGVTLDDWDLEGWTTFFTEDCTYKAMSAENYSLGLEIADIFCDGIGMVEDRVTALRKTSEYETRALRHITGGLRVKEVGDGIIRAESNFAVFEALPYREPTLFAMGKYVDEIVEVGDRLLFRERLAVFDNYQTRTSLIIPL